MKQILPIALLLSLFLNIVLVYRTIGVDEQPTQNTKATSSESILYTSGTSYPLLRVVDGDTLIVGMGTQSEYVRLIGINTPEPYDAGGPECYAREATQHLRTLVQSTGTVVLTFDTTQGLRDTYGRLLAYVELPDGTDVGEAMVRDGFAHEHTYDLPYARRDKYTTAEQQAVAAARGLWSDSACGTKGQ